jgi:hypothetical protein
MEHKHGFPVFEAKHGPFIIYLMGMPIPPLVSPERQDRAISNEALKILLENREDVKPYVHGRN